MDDALRERVEALERTVTGGDHDLSGLADEADALDRLEQLEEQFETIQDSLAELEASTQALRGYVGNIRAVNEDVEQRAELALAKAEEIEAGTKTPDTASKDTDSHSRNVDSYSRNMDSRTRAGADDRYSTRSNSDGCLHESGPSTRKTRCNTCGSVQNAPPGNTDSTTQNGSGAAVTGPGTDIGVSVSDETTHRPPKTDENGVEPPTAEETGIETEQQRADPFESLGKKDPLVSDERDDSGGRLSRFRELL